MVSARLDALTLDREPTIATAEERAMIERLYPALKDSTGLLRLPGPNGEELPLPRPLRLVLAQGALALLQGGGVLVAPIYQELTTNEAARLLNVSRPYLYRLLNDRKIPYTMTGTHRRIRLSDLLEYRRERDVETAVALTELTRLSEEHGLYDAEE